MDADRVSLALKPPWRREQLLLVPATDAACMLRDGGYEEVPCEDTVAEVAGFDRIDLMGLRSFLASARLTAFPLSRLDDREVLTLLTRSIRQRQLVALRPSKDVPGDTSDATAEQRRLIRQIEARSPRGLGHEGRRYRLVAGADLAKLGERDSYEVVPHGDGVATLHAIAREPSGLNDVGPLLVQASAKLAPDWRQPSAPEGLVLLRRLRIAAASPFSVAAPITPSQMKQMLEPSAAVEIELLDDQGQPVADEAFELVLPDGSKRSGQLDANGYAKVTSLPEGAYQVAFPGLDAAAWGPG